MMPIARQTDELATVRRYFGEQVEDAIEKRLGDSAELKDFWFDRVLGQPAVFFRFRENGETKTDFVRL